MTKTNYYNNLFITCHAVKTATYQFNLVISSNSSSIGYNMGRSVIV